MTRDDVAGWIDAYIAAYRSYDPAAIGELYSEDAVHRDSPYSEPVRGRAAIVAHWLKDPDEPGSWQASYEPWALEGDRAVIVGRTDYDDAQGQRSYYNVFLCRFDAANRCQEFTEVYLRQH